MVTCPAPFGVGGLGRHLKEIVDALDRGQQARDCICESSTGGKEASSARNLRTRVLLAMLAPPARFSAAWRIWRASVKFDADAVRRLIPADHLIGFNGTSLLQFRAARRLNYKSLLLMSANSHIRRVIRQHARAYRQYPIERPWATRLVKRNMAEYSLADRIYVASRYVRESFIEEGFPEDILSLFPLTPDPRYKPDGGSQTSDKFNIVYVGSLTVHKGIPLLLEAFDRLSYRDMRLVLVGGWKTRGMRRFLEAKCAHDPRIRVSPGDPLPHMGDARLCVHPAYEDGFAYAPAEALACGVPVIASEDTGMKDLIDPGGNGLVLPTGDLSALTEAIEAAYHGEAFAA